MQVGVGLLAKPKVPLEKIWKFIPHMAMFQLRHLFDKVIALKSLYSIVCVFRLFRRGHRFEKMSILQ